MIRILHVVTSMNMGGIENFIMNIYRKIDRSKVQFDFLKHRDSKDYFDDEIIALGGRIYSILPINPFNIKKYNETLTKFFREHNEYLIIHSHINSFSYYPLRIAKKENVPIRIAHSHATTCRMDYKYFIRLYTKIMLKKQITDAFACTHAAGRWLFGTKEFVVFSNSIDSKKFALNLSIREEIRKKFNMTNKFVIGMVANFSPIKNHSFLIEVFNRVKKTIPNALLLLIGEGKTRKKIEKLVCKYNLKDDVIFLGRVDKVNEILQAVDLFTLTSHSEGFSIAVLEAQTNGIPCIVSNGVPREVKLFEEMNTVFLDLKDINRWVEEITRFKSNEKKCNYFRVCQTDYDVNNNAMKLIDFYQKRLKEIDCENTDNF